MNNQDTNNESIVIADLTAQNADEIKGGPTSQSKRTVVLQSSVAGGSDDDDMSGGLSSNHNETVAADEAADNEVETARLADLVVSEEQSGEVKGGILVGMLLPAIQKVR